MLSLRQVLERNPLKMHDDRYLLSAGGFHTRSWLLQDPPVWDDWLEAGGETDRIEVYIISTYPGIASNHIFFSKTDPTQS